MRKVTNRSAAYGDVSWRVKEKRSEGRAARKTAHAAKLRILLATVFRSPEDSCRQSKPQKEGPAWKAAASVAACAGGAVEACGPAPPALAPSSLFPAMPFPGEHAPALPFLGERAPVLLYSGVPCPARHVPGTFFPAQCVPALLFHGKLAPVQHARIAPAQCPHSPAPAPARAESAHDAYLLLAQMVQVASAAETAVRAKPVVPAPTEALNVRPLHYAVVAVGDFQRDSEVLLSVRLGCEGRCESSGPGPASQRSTVAAADV